MYLFNKHLHPANFIFADRAVGGKIASGGASFDLKTTDLGNNTYHIEIRNPEVWPRDDRTERFGQCSAAVAHDTDARLEITPLAGMTLAAPGSVIKLQAADRHWFATSGTAWMFRFERTPDMLFYGLGEKHTPFERSGRAFTFWNVDAWADHPIDTIVNGDYDPDYISIPYLIIRQENTYIGLLMDCPHAGMISTAADADLSGFLQAGSPYPPSILIGAESGIPSLYCIWGPSLADLTRKLQRLTGTTPLPPLWAIGYHQSRWGYEGEADLKHLAERFASHDFPVDGLWLDIDYDQFMVGPFIMQAPFLTERGHMRSVALPEGRWLRADTGGWVTGARRLAVRRESTATPLFLRQGALIPFQPGVRRDNRHNLNNIGLLCCIPMNFSSTARYIFRADDGLSTAYREGARSEIAIHAAVYGKTLHLRVRTLREGFGAVRVTPYTFHRFAKLVIDQDDVHRQLRPEQQRIEFTGRPLTGYRWQ